MIEHGQSILELLVSIRFATGTQVQRVVFEADATSPRMARHRSTRALRRLFDAGLIRRVRVFAPSSTGRMSQQIINVLSASGARQMSVDPNWIRRRSPQDGAIQVHDFWVVEIAIRSMAGCPPPLEVLQWWDDRALMGRKRRGELSLPTVPDGLLVVRHPETGKIYPSFVEVDLGTESVHGERGVRRDVARKIEGYVEYLEAAELSDFGLHAPGIVLIITDSDRRLESLRQLTQRLGGGGRFWFSTLERTGDRNEDIGQAFTGREGLFWAQNWQTAHDDGWRSLAARCGV
jgi:hypothetical protein